MGQEVTIMRGGVPLVGFGQAEIVLPAAAATSPWAVALVTSVVGAATGWVIEEFARNIRERGQR
jgi:membrane protein YqaA with SNARE-associated domain